MARKYRRNTTKHKGGAVGAGLKPALTTPSGSSPIGAGFKPAPLQDKHAYVMSDIRRIGVIAVAILLGYVVLFVLNQSLGWI